MSHRCTWPLLLILAGCEPVSSLMHKSSETKPSETKLRSEDESALTTAAAQAPARQPLGDLPFHELIARISHADSPPSAPSARPSAWYGTWVRDQGSTRTRLRIERPLIHLVIIDKKTRAGWVLDGHYAIASNGMMYGVMTACHNEALDAEGVEALLDGNERVLRGRKIEKKLMPFSCRVDANGVELSLADFQGTPLEKEREQVLHGAYRKTSVGRPSVAVPSAPLGVRVNDKGNLEVTMVLQPGRVEYRLADRWGRRLNVVGNYDVAPEGVIFGVLTSIEHGEVGKGMAKGRVEPEVFCFRFGFRGNLLVIDEAHSLHLSPGTAEVLLGEYRFPRK